MNEFLTITQINKLLKNVIESEPFFCDIWLRGEISNFKAHYSGHLYFTLKDDSSSIKAVMFKGDALSLKITPADGTTVFARCRIGVYEVAGSYQAYVKELVTDGLGDLYAAFEELKGRLEKEGLFDDASKKPIPKFPKKIGVITSETGAAIQDIFNVLSRRYPIGEVILCPSAVQGENAPSEIVKAINYFNENCPVDVLIVGRGGGSIEDLWAFNERIVAEAVFACKVPIISAVGHETDYTIIDFVSDLRAPTPSAAAELAVYDYHQLMEQIKAYRDTLTLRMENQIKRKQNTHSTYKLHLKYLSPLNQIQEKRMLGMDLEGKLETVMKRKLTAKKHELALIVERMKGLSPLDKLSQGYAFVEDSQGRVIHDISQVGEEDLLQIYVKNGTILAEVKDTQQLEGEKWRRK